MKIFPFRTVKPNLKYITSADTFFSTVKEEYPNYRKTGLFERSGQECVLIYQIQTPQRNHTGIISCVDIREYVENNIKKHEHTLATKEQQQIHLLLLRGAQVKPILLAVRNEENLQNFIAENISEKEPAYHLDFEGDNSKHCFWEVTDWQQIERLQTIFGENVPTAYIADGHHRIAAQSTLHARDAGKTPEDFGHILAAFFPTDELQIWDFNRVIDALEDMSPTLFMAKLSKLFDIEILEEIRKPLRKHEIIMITKGEIYALTWRPKIIEEYYENDVLLDVKMLNDKVLQDILGIEDVRTDTRVRYVEGVAGTEKVRDKVIKSDHRIGFILYPVQMADFMKISDAGAVLPPKSTWFEPRMKNGLAVRDF